MNSSLILYTSGSTKEPKEVNHSWEYLNSCIKRSIKEIKLTKSDIVLDVYPANTIAHYTVTAMPAKESGAHLISLLFDPFNYIKMFNKYRPTYISLIPRHYEILKKTKGWNDFDMSCVRYMVTGSGKIEQQMIDDFLNRGVQLVANWYGMTEFPPPVMIGYNSTKFNFKTLNQDDHVMFIPLDNNLSECVINGRSTGDLFDMNNLEFHSRRIPINADARTWKT
jgi:long-subunit acyl-CoA synthetase (AMP-forming)